MPAGAQALDGQEGLERTDLGRRLQASFLTHGAAQCGFCMPGMLLAAYALLSSNPRPSRDEIREAVSGNLCRCTGYTLIVDAVEAVVAGAGGTP